MVTSPGQESTLADVATNLATVCAEVGQTVALLSTAIFATPAESDEESSSPPLWWLSWPEPQETGTSVDEQRRRLQTDDVRVADVDALLGETGVEGVRRLDLRYFVRHSAQVVIRVPQVIAALRQVVDVVILEVPAYLTVHHGEGLTPDADVVLVVGERTSTTMDDLRRAKAALTRLAAPVVGVVLTGEHQSEDLWGVESGEDSDDYESSDDTETRRHPVVVGADDTAPVPIVDVSTNHPTENGSTENGARERDSADAVLARRDSPEA
jgi:hypothetical protein